MVDDQTLGTTPALLKLEPGQHAIVGRAQDAIDVVRTVYVDTGRLRPRA